MHLTPEGRQIPGTFAITDPSPTTVVFSDRDAQEDDRAGDNGYSLGGLVRHLTKVISRYETLPFGSVPTPFDELSNFGNERPELGALERAIHSMAMRALSAENALISGSRLDLPTRPQVPQVTVTSANAEDSIEAKLQRIERSIAEMKVTVRASNEAQTRQVVDTSHQQELMSKQTQTLENSSRLVVNLDYVAQDVYGQTAKMKNLTQAVSDVAVDMKYVGQGVFGMQAQTQKALSELSDNVQQIASSLKNKPKLRVDLGSALTPLENRICTLIEAVEKNNPTTRPPIETTPSRQQPLMGLPNALSLEEDNKALENHAAVINSQNHIISTMSSQVAQMATCVQAIAYGDLQAARTLLASEMPDSVPATQFNELRDALGSLTKVVENTIGGIQQGLQPQNRRMRRDSQSIGMQLNGCWRGLTEVAHNAGDIFQHETQSTAWALQNIIEGKFDMDLPPQRGEVAIPTRRAITTLTTILRDMTTENTRFFKELSKGNLLERVDMTNLQGSWANPADAANRMADRLASQTYEMIETLSAASSGDVNARNSPREIEDGSGPVWMIGTNVNEYLNYIGDIHQELKTVATLTSLNGDQPARTIDDEPTHAWHQGSWDPLRVDINTMISAMNAARLQRRRTR